MYMNHFKIITTFFNILVVNLIYELDLIMTYYFYNFTFITIKKQLRDFKH